MMNFDFFELINVAISFSLGKNCEIDINECESNPCQFNGTCLEHSDIDLFVGRHPTTPPPMMGTLPLPKFFHQDFNYSIASG